MNLEDFDAFCEVVLGFAELKGKQLSSPALKLYFRSLQDWSLAEFTTAAAHLLKHHPYPTVPTPADFEALRKAGEPTAAEAWAIVLSGAPLPPGSRMARAAAACGGRYAILHEDVERSLPFTQKRFLEAYEDLTKVDPVREALPHIAAHGARAALSAPTSIANFVPPSLIQEPTEPQSRPVALSAPIVAPAAAKVATPPPKSTRDRVIALLPLQFSDEDIAKIAGEPVDVVRQVRAEQGRAA